MRGWLSLVGSGMSGQPVCSQDQGAGLHPSGVDAAWNYSRGFTDRAGIVYVSYSITSPGSKTLAIDHHGLWGIMGYFDSAAPPLPDLVAQDLVEAEWVSGDSWHLFGFHHSNATDEAAFVGVYWFADPTNKTWFATVKTGTANPSTSVFSEDSGISAEDPHRLAIVLDGSLKKAQFFIDNALYSEWKPTALPAQFGVSGTYFGHSSVCAVSASCKLHCYGGGNPAALAIVDAR